MDFIKGLPPAARIAIPAVGVLLLAVLLYATVMRGPSQQVLIETKDKQQFQAYAFKLSQANIAHTEGQRSDGTLEIMVSSDVIDSARQTLSVTPSGKKMKKGAGCPKPSAMAMGRAAERKEKKCQIETSIEQTLEGMTGTGILAASATYDVKEEGGFDAKEIHTASVSLYIDPTSTTRPNPRALAQIVQSKVASMTLEQVSIFDQNATPIWNKDMMTQATAGGCQDTGEKVAITDRERLMADCVSSQLEKELGDIVGGEENVRVLAKVDLQATNATHSTTTTRGSRGGSTRSSSTIDKTSVSSDAGFEKARKVTVMLNKRTVKPSQKVAIEQSLKTLMPNLRDTKVQLVEFGSDDSAKLAAEATAEAAGPTGTPATNEPNTPDPSTQNEALTAKPAGIPGAVVVTAFLLMLGLVTVVLLLWRRNVRLASERKNFEAEFQNDFQRFQSVAQQSPDDVARELEALLGGQR